MHRAKTQPTRALLALVGGIVLTTALLFGRTATYEFCNFDDPVYVVDNMHVHTGLTRQNALWALSSTHGANWHPLTWWSLELDASLYGLRAGGYHVTNVVLHAANALLLLWALRKMTGALLPSACVAALFAIHPLHVESVAWIAERKDVLSTLFWMLALIAYARYAERPSPWRYGQVVAAMILGLMAKPMLVTLPFVLLLLDFWPLRRWPKLEVQGPRSKVAEEVPGSRIQVSGCGSPKPKVQSRRMTLDLGPWTLDLLHPSSLIPHPSSLHLVVEKLPLLALSLASCVVTVVAQAGGGAVAEASELSVKHRLMNVPVAYLAYLEKAAWPEQLCVFYPHPTTAQPPAVAWIATTLVLGATIWICRRWRRQPYLTVGWFWYLGTLVPVIGLVQVGVQAIADRYAYVPLIGIFVGAVWGFAELVRRGLVSRRLVAALAVACFTSFGACTWVQVGYWRDSVALWEHALEITGPNAVACGNLGEALLRSGQLGDAVKYLRISTAMAPRNAPGRASLGLALFQTGHRDEGEAELLEALRLEPDYVPAHGNLGILLRARGRRDEAVAHFREVLRIEPADWFAHQKLGETLIEQGQIDEGRRHLREASRLNPHGAAGGEMP